MLSGYAAGEQIIGRQTIEEVAGNLDLLPRNEMLAASKQLLEIGSARVLTAEAREELWNNQSRVEVNKPKKFSFSNDNSNGGENRIPRPIDNLDDEINLEIGEVGGFY